MSVRRLPKIQQEEVEAIVTASKILKKMTDAQIVSISDTNNVKKHVEDMKKQFEEIKNVVNAA